MVSIRIAVCCVLLFHCALSSESTTTNTTTEVHHESPTATTESHHESENTTGTELVSKSTESEHYNTTVGQSESTTDHSVQQNSTEGITGNATESSTTYENETTTTFKPLYPPGDPKNCPNFKALLTALPGHGWDNLVYKTKKDVFSYNYSLCHTTFDKKYLIPNNVYVMSELPNSIDNLKTKIFTDYNQYTSVVYENAKLSAGLRSFRDVVGSFSQDFQNVKTKMFEDKAVAVRVELSQQSYRVGISSGKRPLDPEFRKALIGISEYLVNGNTELASYNADLLVKKYGTQYAETITVGGSLVTEDVVRKTLVDTQSEEGREKLSKIAKNVFYEHYRLKENFTREEFELMSDYKNERTSNKVVVFGGHQNATDFNFTEWEEALKTDKERIQIVDSFSLENLITVDQFEDLPPPLVQRVKNSIHEAIVKYYKYNTHAGCIDPTAKNFVFGANYDDQSCNASEPEHYSFGGLYQTCESSGDKKYCEGYEAKNPETGDYSCPKDFIEVPLRFREIERTDSNECLMKCTMDPVVCYLVCKMKEDISRIEYKAYWCVNPDPKSKAAGVPFGGLFTSQYANPNTGLRKCPSGYESVKIDSDINVCVGKPKENNNETAIPFGGFFSCANGNPLSAKSNDHIYEYYWPKSCPNGFHAKIADVVQKCTIGYCTVLPHKQQHTFPALVVLASGQPPKEKGPLTTAVVILDEINHDVYYRKTPTGPWQRAHNAEELKEAGLDGLLFDLYPPTTTLSSANNETSTTDKVGAEKEEDSSSKNWTIAVVVITLIAVVAALGVGGYVYMKKKRDAGQSDSSPIVANEEGSSNQMEEPKTKSESYDEPPATASGGEEQP